jgi:FkbM family methyltransferase
MKQFLLRLASRLTANRFSQVCLLHGVRLADYLMGVGAGSSVSASGEESVLRRIGGLSESGELVIFDVGANHGQFLQMSAKALAGRPCQMHCFEPSKAAYALLSRRAEGLKNVILNNVGLGRETGDRLLFADKLGSGLASLTKRRLDHFGIGFSESETVSIETLDNYCAFRGIDHIDLLKIDVEGHELDVLAGAAEMLRKRAIRFVTFEFGGCNIDTRTSVQDFYYLFARYDMRIARITPAGGWFELGDYREIYEQFRTTNFVAYCSSGR